MNIPIYQIKSRSKSLFYWRNSMKLSIMRTHNCAVIADQLFTWITEVSQWLAMQEAHLLCFRVLLVHKLSSKTRIQATCHASILWEVTHRSISLTKSRLKPWARLTWETTWLIDIRATLFTDKIWLTLKFWFKINSRS